MWDTRYVQLVKNHLWAASHTFFLNNSSSGLIVCKIVVKVWVHPSVIFRYRPAKRHTSPKNAFMMEAIEYLPKLLPLPGFSSKKIRSMQKTLMSKKCLVKIFVQFLLKNDCYLSIEHCESGWYAQMRYFPSE